MYLPLLVLLSVCSAIADTTVWSPGTGLWLYGQPQQLDGKCPTTKKDAGENTDLCRVYVSEGPGGGKVLCDRNPSITGRRFLNANGFADQGLLVKSARLKAVEVNSPTGGGCWTLQGPNLEAGISPCNLADSSQKLYIRPIVGSDGAFYIFADANALPLAVGTAGALTASSNQPPIIFCIYDSEYGKLVAPPAQDRSYFSPESVTNLTGIVLPGRGDPLPELALPGCRVGAPEDCLIARAVNGMPDGCEANPSKRLCVLHLAAAFCFDVPMQLVGEDASAQVEACFRRVALGPCVANPGGAACISGQFAGIVQFGSGGGGSPGGSTSRKRDISSAGSMTGQVLRRADPGPLFSDENQLPAEDQFWVGVMKNLLNGIVDLLNAFRNSMFQSSHISCLSMTTRFPDENSEAGARIRKGCGELFKPHPQIPNLPLDGDVEKAGSVFADVVTLLSAAADIAKAAQAAKFVGGVKAILAKFRPRPLNAGEGVKGIVLEAIEGENTVQIFREAGDGKPMGVHTEEDFDALHQSIADEAFDNCRPCIGPPVKRDAYIYPRGLSKKLCCIATPKTLEEGTSEAQPRIPDYTVAPRTVGDLLNPAGLPDDGNILPRMTGGFKKWYSERGNVPLVADQTTARWDERLSSAVVDDAKWQVRSNYMATYGLSTADAENMGSYVEFNKLDPDKFRDGIAKLPPMTGLLHRSVDLSPEGARVYIEGLRGPTSKGERGIYDIEELALDSYAEMKPSGSRGHARPIMAANLAFQYDRRSAALYRFILNSRSGRYVAPLRPLYNRGEVVFIQGFSGKFRLIGYQPLNGGEAARVAGSPGPYGVF